MQDSPSLYTGRGTNDLIVVVRSHCHSLGKLMHWCSGVSHNLKLSKGRPGIAPLDKRVQIVVCFNFLVHKNVEGCGCALYNLVRRGH